MEDVNIVDVNIKDGNIKDGKMIAKVKTGAILLLLFCLTMLFMTGCNKNVDYIKTHEDVKHAKIGVMIGSTGDGIARRRFPGADVKGYTDTMDAIAALKARQVDAVLAAYATALYTSKNNPDIGFLAEAVESEDSGIAVKKGNEELLSKVNAILSEFKADGTLADMKKRWFKTDNNPYVTVNIELPKSGEPLRIGTNATREPFTFVDGNGKQSGHDGELAYRIAQKMGRPVEFLDMSFTALIPALQSGKIDLIVTGMTATTERAKSVDFSIPYFVNDQMLIVRKAAGGGPVVGESAKMSTLSDIANKRIGVMEGTIFDGFVQANYPKAGVMRYKGSTDLILNIKTGKVDVGLMVATSANEILKTNDDLGILSDEVFPIPLGVGFNKNNPALRARFNNYLETIKRDGTYEQMIRRWFVEDAQTAKMPQIPIVTNGERIKVGVSIADLPYIAMVSNEYVGFDIEMIRRFAQREGFSVEFMTMDFSALIAALASGKVDMISDGIAITPERQKQIDFSDEYIREKTAAVALKANLAAYGDQAGASKSTGVTFLQNVRDSFYNNIILEKRYLLILNGLMTTVVISLLTAIFGTLLGGLVCFLRMSRNKASVYIAKIYISILRGMPVLVLLMLIFYVVFASVDINPVLVAVLAFGMNFAAYVSEMFRTGIEGVDRGQTEAALAMGFTKIRTFLYIVLPQAIRRILPVYKGEFISMVKMTSIVGYIAVQDLTKASDIIRSRTFDAFFPLVMVAILYFIISGVFIMILEYFEHRTDPKLNNSQT